MRENPPTSQSAAAATVRIWQSQWTDSLLPLPCPVDGLHRIASSLAPPVEHRELIGELCSPIVITKFVRDLCKAVDNPPPFLSLTFAHLAALQFLLALRPGHLSLLSYKDMEQAHLHSLHTSPFKHSQWGMILPLSTLTRRILLVLLELSKAKRLNLCVATHFCPPDMWNVQYRKWFKIAADDLVGCCPSGPHSLRRMRATGIHLHGASQETIAAVLGHAGVGSVTKYVRAMPTSWYGVILGDAEIFALA